MSASPSSRKSLLLIFVTVFIDLLGFGIVLPLLPRYGEHFLPTEIQSSSALAASVPSAAPGYVAAILSGIAFLYGLFVLPESLKTGDAPKRHGNLFNVLAGLRAMIRGPHALILGSIFLTTFAFAQFESTLSLLTRYLGGVESQEPDWRRGVILGGLMSSFSLMQFLFAPLWGRLSDRIGRRPVLLVGLAGSTVAYLLFALVTQWGNRPLLGLHPLVWLYLTRIGAGISGATISTAQAYIADCTDEKSRGKGMALIGAAFGIGFTFGPLLGAAFVSGDSGGHGMSDRANFLVFAYIGFLLTLSQGLLVRRLIPRLGEYRMGLIGVALMSLGMLLIGVASHQTSIGLLFLVLPVVVVGYSAATPALLSLLSLTSGKDEQGELLGIGQSMSSMARILGPVVGLSLQRGMGIAVPYWFAAVLMGISIFGVWGLRSAGEQKDAASPA